MATVVRFVFQDTTEIFVQGVGLVKNGIFDVPATDTVTVAIVRTRLAPYGVTEEMADDSIPASPPIRFEDPYPQYLNQDEADAKYAPKSSGGNPGASQPRALGKLYAALATRRVAPVRLAFAGSSTMEGVLASSKAATFVDLLVTALQVAYPSGVTEHTVVRSNTAAFGTPSAAVGVQGYNAGKSGATSADYLTGTTIGIVAALNPRAVFHMVGSNDFRDSVAPAAVATNVRAKIDALNAQITGRPVVHILIHQHQRIAQVGTVPWSQYRDALAGLAAADPDNVAFLDLSGPFELSGVPGTDPLNLVGPDDIHLTDAGYFLLFDAARRALNIPAGPGTVAAPTGPATIVSDTFDRADAATLGVAQTGQTWTDGGAWKIETNRATATGNAHAFVEVGSGDMDVQADIYYLGGNVPAGIQFNSTDSGNRCVLYINPVDTVTGTVVLANFGGSAPGVAYTGPAGAVNCAAGQVHQLRAVSKGDVLTVYLNGTQLWTYTMTSAESAVIKARTKAGLRQSSPTTLSLDNFIVKAPA